MHWPGCLRKWLGRPSDKNPRSQRVQPAAGHSKTIKEVIIDRQRQLRTQSNNLHDPIVSRLFPEIASYIFELCVPDQWPDDKVSWLTKAEVSAPLTLGSVCRTWRRIAWTTPQIWTFISIHLTPACSAKLRTRYKIVKEWLGRSGQLPLFIQIQAPVSTSPFTVMEFEPLIEFINQLSNRWKGLDLQVPHCYIPRFCGDSGGAMALRKLRLYKSSIPSTNFRLKNGKARPNYLSISGLPPKDVHIEWSHVTHLSLGSLALQEYFDVLQCAPRLISCTFEYVNPTSADTFKMPDKPIINDQLRDLETFSGYSCSVILNSMFFNSITLPVLENLFCHFQRNNMPTDSIISLLDRSSCHLKTLSISFPRWVRDDSELIRLLKASTSIQHLYLEYISAPTYKKLIRLLASNTASSKHGDSDPLLPALESLRYISDSTEPISWKHQPDIFGPLAQIHSSHRRPLKKLELWFLGRRKLEGALEPHEYIGRESVVRFLKLIENGIILDFKLIASSQECNLLELSMEYHGVSNDSRRSLPRSLVPRYIDRLETHSRIKIDENPADTEERPQQT